MSSLFSGSSLAARPVCELGKETEGVRRSGVCPVMPSWSSRARSLLPRDRQTPAHDSCEHTQLLGFSARGPESKHCSECSRPRGLPAAASDGAESGPGERAWRALYLFGDDTATGTLCVFRTGERARRERQPLSAVTALVAWLGLAGIRAVGSVFLGVACPALAPGWHQAGEELRGQAGLFVFVYFKLPGPPKTTGIF